MQLSDILHSHYLHIHHPSIQKHWRRLDSETIKFQLLKYHHLELYKSTNRNEQPSYQVYIGTPLMKCFALNKTQHLNIVFWSLLILKSDPLTLTTLHHTAVLQLLWLSPLRYAKTKLELVVLRTRTNLSIVKLEW